MGSTPSARRRRLGELLLDAGLLDATRLEAALAEQRKWGGKLGRTLVEMGFVDEESMVRALSRQLKLPVVDLDQVTLPPSIVGLLRVDLAERYGVFPIGADAKGRTLQLATSDPTNGEALNELEFRTNAKIQIAVATASSIDRAIRRLYYGEDTRPVPAPPASGEAAYELKVPEPPAPAASPQPPPFDPHLELEGAADRAEVSRLKEQVTGLEKTTAHMAVLKEQVAQLDKQAAPVARLQEQLAALEKQLAPVARLREQVADLEKNSAHQVRAMRALVEQLIESGLISRDEYVARIKRGD